MKIGLISDIHSNSEALRSVIHELEREGAGFVINTGDNVGYSAFPDACVEIIRKEGFYNIMGNYDDAVSHDRDDCGCGEGDAETLILRHASLEWTKENTKKETKEYLVTLPASLDLQISGTKFFAMHGGLELLNEFIYENDDAALVRVAESVEADIIVLGHTHKPFIREIGGKVFINPGSIGKPVDGDPRASYATVELAGGIRIELKRASYDVEKNIRDLIRAGLPEKLGEILRYARETGNNSCCIMKPVSACEGTQTK